MINFTRVRWKNLLSTGNAFTEIQLDKSPNTLIVGSNGAGKSTILDALCFGLFGKPFRRIVKPGLVNSINQGQCLVEVEFTIGRKTYKVSRGIKPNIFEIYTDGKLINQDAKAKDYQDHLEKFILKLNYKTFTQVVILGSASFVPFMQLSPADRRNIIEDLLDIQIFSSMNFLVKQKMSDIKEVATQLTYQAKLTADKIELQKQNIQEHKKNSAEQIQKKQDEIQENEQYVTQLTRDIAAIEKHMHQLQAKTTDKEILEKKEKEVLVLGNKLESASNRLTKEVLFYTTNDDCPTCHQHIDAEFKGQQLEEKNARIKETEEAIKQLNKQKHKLENKLEAIKEITDKILEHSSEIVRHTTSIKAVNKYIEKLQGEIRELENTHKTIGTNSKLKELKKELTGILEQQEELSIEKYYYEYASNMLKDTGIKTKIIKQYLPIMNKLINKYLTALDFFVNFNIDESFQESIKSRHRDDFTYDSFSEGEKMRIDLSLTLAWRQVAAMKNSCNTNLLILDEIFDSSLDTVGTDNFLKIMGDMTKNANIFVISHKTDQLSDRFASTIRFDKRNNFSVMEYV